MIDYGAKQIIFLDFDGADTVYDGTMLHIDGVNVENSGISGDRAANLADKLNGFYRSSNIVFVTEKPLDGEFSTICVGNTSAFEHLGDIGGIAETVDKGNLIKNDNAFVIADADFSDNDIINLIIHETGHLLGSAHAEETGTIADFFADPGPTVSDLDSKTLASRVWLIGGTATRTNIISGGQLTLDRATGGQNIIVSDGGVLALISGAVAKDTIVSSGGSMLLQGWDKVPIPSASNTTIENGGWMSVLTSATAENVFIGSGGTLEVDAKGGGSNTCTTVNNIEQESGGAIRFVLENNSGGGMATVTNGSNVVSNFGVITSKIGTDVTRYVATNFLLENGGKLELKGPEKDKIQIWASNTILRSGGSLHVHAGATADTVSQDSGGAIIIEDGAQIFDGMHRKGSFHGGDGYYYNFLLENGGKMNIDHSNVVNTAVSSGGVLNMTGGVAGNTYVYANGVLSATGGRVINTTVTNGGEAVIDGTATNDNMTIFYGGSAVLIGGFNTNIYLNYGASLTVSTDAELHHIFVPGKTSGYDELAAKVEGNVASDFVLNKGFTLWVKGGHTAIDTTVNNGGIFRAEGGGIVRNITLNAGGMMNLGVYSDEKGNMRGTAVSVDGLTLKGGMLLLSSLVSVANGKNIDGSSFTITNNVVNGLVLHDGVYMLLLSGHTANNITLRTGGRIDIADGAFVSGLQLAGGAFTVTTNVGSFAGNGTITGGEARGVAVTSGSELVINDGHKGFDLQVDSGGALRMGVGKTGAVTGLVASSGAIFEFDTADTVTGNYNYAGGAEFYIKNGATHNIRIESTGKLHIHFAHSANSTYIGNAGLMTMSAGAKANNTEIASGGVQHVSGGLGNGFDSIAELAGAEANNNTIFGSQVVFGGSRWDAGLGRYVAAGGIANRNTVNSGGIQDIRNGGLANSTWVSSGGVQMVGGGGLVNSSVISSGGALRMANTGEANSVTILSGGLFSAYTGAVVSYGMHRMGEFYMNSTGLAYNVLLENGGELRVLGGHTASNTQVEDGGLLYVSCTGKTNGTHIYANGSMYLEINTVATNIVQERGAAIILTTLNNISGRNELSDFSIVCDYKGATASGLLLENGGALQVLAGHFASDTVVRSGGYVDVVSSGSMTNLTISSFGSALVSRGGLVNNMSLDSRASATINKDATVNGMIVKSGGALITDNRATIINGSNAMGTFYISEGKASGLMIESGGHFNIHSDGVVSSVILNNGGSQTVRFFANTIGTVINSGGVEFLDEGHAKGSLIYNGGKQIVTSNPLGAHYNYSAAKYDGYHKSANAFQTEIFSGGIQDVLSNGKTMSTFIRSGGVQNVSATGLVSSTFIMNAGEQNVYAGGVASHTYISAGTQNLFRGSANYVFIYSGGVQNISSGGVARRTNIYQSGIQNVYNAGLAEVTSLHSGSIQNVYNGALANSTVLNTSSVQNVFSGGRVEFTTLNDDSKQFLNTGAVANQTTVNSNASMTVKTGAAASNTIVNSNGWFMLENGGSAFILTQNKDAAIVTNTGATIQSGIHTGNIQFSMVNGVASNFLLESRAQLTVNVGHSVTGATRINGGGQMILSGNNIMRGSLMLAGGTLTVNGNVKATGTQVTIDFREYVANSGPVISHIARLDGAAFAITVNAKQDSGEYILGEYATGFNQDISLTVYDDSGMSLYTLKLGVEVRTGNAKYLLTLSANNTLSLKITTLNRVFDDRVLTGTVSEPDMLVLADSDTANRTIVKEYGFLVVGTGAKAYDSVVNDRGNMTLNAGGIIGKTTINRGGTLTVKNGATVNSTVNIAGKLIAEANLDVSGGSFNFIMTGQTLADDVMVDNIGNLAGASFTISIASGKTNGRYKLAAGAAAFDQDVTLTVDGSGSGGGFGTLSRYQKVIIGDKQYSLVIDGDILYFQVDKKPTDPVDPYTVNAREYQENFVIARGKTQTVNGGETMSVTIQRDGAQIVTNGGLDTKASISGTQTVSDGGVAAMATVNAGGTQDVKIGGYAVNTAVRGLQNVFLGGQVTSSVVANGGRINVMGTANVIIVNGGGFISVATGGTANRVTVNNGATLEFGINSTMTGLNAMNGAIIDGNSGANISVGSLLCNKSFSIVNGRVNNLTLGDKSKFTLLAGHRIDNLWLNQGGALTIVNGGTAGGTIYIDGALNFNLDGMAGGNVMVENLTIGTNASLSVSVSGQTGGGDYLLAGNAGSFTGSITVNLTQFGMQMSLKVGESFKYNDVSYTLTLRPDNVLTFTVSSPKPDHPRNDFDGNGKSDMLFINRQNGELWIWGDSDAFSAKYLGVRDFTQDRIMAVGDFNGDGKADILWQCGDKGYVGFWNGADANQWTYIGDFAPSRGTVVGVGNFNNKANSDIVWRTADGTVGAWLDGTSQWQTLGKVGADWEVVDIADYLGDGKSDILWRNKDTGLLGMWLDGDMGKWLELGTQPQGWSIAGNGDFDGDGKEEVLWHNAATGEVGSWTISVGEIPLWKVFGTGGTDWNIVGTGDTDGNGKDDFIWRNNATGEIGCWMDGDSTRWSVLGSTFPDYKPFPSIA